MGAPSGLVELMKAVASEPDVDRALDRIVQASLDITGSRHAMIARLDQERGALELRHGAGPEWNRKGANIRIDLDQDEGIVAYVAATGTTVVSGDVSEDPRYRNLFGTTQSEIATPIRDLSGRIRAVMNVESDALHAYRDDSVRACEAMAALASVLIERADARDREEALVEVGSALDRAQTEDELLGQVIQVASGVLRFQASSIFLQEADGDRFMLRATMGRLKDRIGSIGYRKGEGCTGWVCGEGKPMLLLKPQDDPRWRGRYLEFPSEEIAGFLAVPILLRGKSIGAIRVIRRVSENPHLDTRFTQSDQRVLQAIAEQVAIGLDSIRSVEKLLRSERMSAWGELSARSSHMMGNRVFAIKGDVNELDYLLGQPDLDRGKLLEIARSLGTNLTRIEEILQDFRDFVSATKVELAAGDVRQLAQETVEEVFPKRSKVRLELHLGPTPPVSFDAKRLRRAMSELIENSMSFMEKGSLTVSTGVATAEHLAASGLPVNKEFVAIEVADTGPGVEDEQKQRIFQPFFTRRVKGMGLGLSIVKGIVEAHGGDVLEMGQFGQGARFLILLPVAIRPKLEET